MSTKVALGTVFWLALGCSASATSNPMPRQNGDGGASGTSTTSSGGSVSPAGGGASAGTASASGGTFASGGASSAGTGGSTPINHAGSGGSAAGASAGTGGSGNRGPVSTDLPYTEDWESGAINHIAWAAVDTQVLDAAYADWSVVTDDTGHAAQLQSDGNERFLVGGNGTWTDQKLELRVQVVSGSPEVDIAFRFNAVKEYYYLEFADSHFKVRDRTGANSDLQPTGSKPALVVGTWYKLTLQIKGTAVSASLNDVVVASGTFASTPIAAGGIAIGVGSGTGVVLFDDIHVTLP